MHPSLTDRAGLPVWVPASTARLPVDAVVTTRHGGVSTGHAAGCNLGLHVGDDPAAVVENRRRAAAAVGLGLDDLVVCRQVHGTDVVAVERGMAGTGARSAGEEVPAGDVLVTADAGVGLVVLVADCVPVLLIDPAAGVLALVHAGWRGTTAGVLDAALRAILERGGRTADVHAVIGPAVPAPAYQVGADVRQAAEAALGAAVDELVPPDDAGRWTMDLVGALRHQLASAGVPAGHVEAAPLATGPGEPCYSHRLEGPTGRFGMLAVLRG